jgi:SAM-dependent methyltransferase
VGMGLAFLEYMVEKQLLCPGSRVLDIGSQNLYNATPAGILRLIDRLGPKGGTSDLTQAAEKLSYFSTPRPGERTAFVAELLSLTSVSYLGYDVCPAPQTEILDLNIERLPVDKRDRFDLVLNFGTTEHILNQLNSFEVMHDALKVGGVIFHQLPSVGWIDHGYFNYNALLVDDLVKTNDYEVLDRFFTVAGQSEFASTGIDIRDPNTPTVTHSAKGPDTLLNFNLNYVVRKKFDAPFYVGLEIATTHSPLSKEAESIYGGRRRLAAGEAIRSQLPPPKVGAPLLRRWFRPQVSGRRQ